MDSLRQPFSEEKKEENHNHNGKDEDQDDEEDDVKMNADEQIKFDAKIKVLVKELRRLQREKPNEKSLVFTSCAPSLDWICNELRDNDIVHRTLAGNMTMQKRG